MSEFWIIGGEYTDTTFSTLVNGAEQKFGPFESYEAAEAAWAGKAWETVDSCNTRFKIVEQ